MSEPAPLLDVLRAAAEADPPDARALNAYAEALDAAGRGADALACWEKAARADRAWALPWRRLGVAYFRVAGEKVAAKGALQRAFRLERSAETLVEIDALARATQALPRERLEELEKDVELVRGNDALRVAAAEALNLVGRFDHAKGLLLERTFAGPHAAAGAAQFRRAEIALLRQAFWRGDDTHAAWEALLEPLAPFGGVPATADEQAELHYWLGNVCRKQQAVAEAQRHWVTVAENPRGQALGDFYAGLALRELGWAADAEKVFVALEESSRSLPPTSGDAEIHARFIEALARYGLRETRLARRLLGDVLRDDPNHALAADFMLWLDWQI